MTAGIAPTPDELEETKVKILNYLSVGYGRTLYGAAQMLGYQSTSSIYAWMTADEAFKEAVGEARKIGVENALDLAENGSMKLLAAEDPKHVRWFLEMKGKDRGYSRRTEITGANGADLNKEAADARNALTRGTVLETPAPGTDSAG